MIICFSGTGNSLAVARSLSARLGDTVVRLGASAPESLSAVTDSRIVWVMPVHCWGLPRYAVSAIRRLAIEGAEAVPHFLVLTCGDDTGLADRQWRRLMRRKGWKPLAAHSVFMPNTYVLLPGFDVDKASVAAAKMKRMPEAVERIAHAIKCRSGVDSLHRGRMAWLKSRVLYPLFMRFLTSPKPFGADAGCVACGRCSEVCPLGNVTLAGADGPRWGTDCTLCLGCYHVCPKHAVHYGSATSRKGQWNGNLRNVRY